VVKDLNSFADKAFDAEKSKQSGSLSQSDSDDKEGKSDFSGDSQTYPTDVQSVRKWAKTLNPVDKRIIIDTIKSTM